MSSTKDNDADEAHANQSDDENHQATINRQSTPLLQHQHASNENVTVENNDDRRDSYSVAVDGVSSADALSRAGERKSSLLLVN